MKTSIKYRVRTRYDKVKWKCWLRPALVQMRPRINAIVAQNIREEHARLRERMLKQGFAPEEITEILAR